MGWPQKLIAVLGLIKYYESEMAVIVNCFVPFPSHFFPGCLSHVLCRCVCTCALTCGCVGLFDSQLFGGEACFNDAAGWSEAARVETPQKQSEAQHDHLQLGGRGKISANLLMNTEHVNISMMSHAPLGMMMSGFRPPCRIWGVFLPPWPAETAAVGSETCRGSLKISISSSDLSNVIHYRRLNVD